MKHDTSQALNAFFVHYCNSHRPNFRASFDFTKRTAEMRGWKMPSASTFRRRFKGLIRRKMEEIK